MADLATIDKYVETLIKAAECDKVVEENKQLKQENDDLKQKIENLKHELYDEDYQYDYAMAKIYRMQKKMFQMASGSWDWSQDDASYFDIVLPITKS